MEPSISNGWTNPLGHNGSCHQRDVHLIGFGYKQMSETTSADVHSWLIASVSSVARSDRSTPRADVRSAPSALPPISSASPPGADSLDGGAVGLEVTQSRSAAAFFETGFCHPRSRGFVSLFFIPPSEPEELPVSTSALPRAAKWRPIHHGLRRSDAPAAGRGHIPAHSAARGAVERLEHLFQVRFGNAIATVADRQGPTSAEHKISASTGGAA